MKKLMKESYEVSPELADKLNSILADEWLAHELYHYAIVAMVGNKNHQLEELSEKNAEDEMDDHFKNLYTWMQSKGIKCVTDHKTMEEITNCTKFKVEDGMSTREILDMLLVAEQEAIDVYEDIIPETKLDLNTMLCGFLKDEREHLKDLTDIQNEMDGNNHRGSSDRVVDESDSPSPDVRKVLVTDIQWDFDDGEEDDSLPTEVWVDVPGDVEDDEEYISDYLSDTYGYCHNGFIWNVHECSNKKVTESTEKTTGREFINVSELRKSFEGILKDSVEEWKKNYDPNDKETKYIGYMIDSADDYMDEYVDDLVSSTVRDMDKYVHKDSQSVFGNFADIKEDWNRSHKDGVNFHEIVDMIDSGENNNDTKEFKDWAVDWFFNAFGTYNIKYNWSNFMEEISSDYDDGSYDESTDVASSETLTATATISSDKLKTINLCLSGMWTPEDMDVEPESEVLKVTGIFEDGCEADIILHASEDDFYTDGVLYDDGGHQLAMTDVCDNFDGEWEFEVDGQKYVCNVVVK